MSHQASDLSLFWDLLAHQPTLQQSLAKVSLASLTMRLDAVRRGRFTSATRAAFDRWTLHSVRVGKQDMATRVEEVTTANAALEQRVSKLKTLLARMHHASQRHTEESAAIKKVQKEAAKEIQSVRSKEEQEKRLLELQLRNFEIENAFKEDVEISIQRAAHAVTQSYSSKSGPGSLEGRADSFRHDGREDSSLLTGVTSRSDLPVDNEVPQSEITEAISAMSAELASLKQRLNEAQLQNNTISKKMDTLILDLSMEKKRNSVLKDQLADETSTRKDIEAELNIIISREGKASRELENQITVETNARIMELTRSLSESESRVADLANSLQSTMQQLEKARKETASFRSSLYGMKKLENENKQLNIMLREFRKNAPSNRSNGNSKSSTNSSQVAVQRVELPPGAVVADGNALGDVFSIAAYSVSAWRSYQIMYRAAEDLLIPMDARCLNILKDIPLDSNWLSALKSLQEAKLSSAPVFDQLDSHCNVRDLILKAADTALSVCDLFLSDNEEISIRKDALPENCSPFMSLPAILCSIEKWAEDTTANEEESPISRPSPVTALCDLAVQEEPEPMVWEAHSVTLAPGKAAVVPVLLSVNATPGHAENTVCLEWILWGDDDLSYLGVSISGLTDESNARLVQSRHMNMKNPSRATSYSGRAIPSNVAGVVGTEALDVVKGDVKLSIVNNAMWSSMTFSYSVRLTREGIVDKVSMQGAHETVETALHEVYSPKKRVIKKIDEVAIDRCLSSVRDVIVRLQAAKASVGQALDTYDAVFMTKQQYRTRLDKAISEYNHSVWKNLWYLLVSGEVASSGIIDRGLAESLLPVNISHLNLPLDLCGADLAAYALNYSQGEIFGNTEGRLSLQKNSCQEFPSVGSTPVQSPRGQLALPPTKALDSAPVEKLSFSAEGILIPAGADFRLPVTVSAGSTVHISWNLKLIGKDDIEEGDRRVVGPSDPATAKSDIGFTVLLRKRDGTLPMLIPYKRVCQSLKADLGSATFKIPVEDVDSSHEYDAGNETTLNILFDNSYSWFSAKTLRYSVSIEEEKVKQGEVGALVRTSEVEIDSKTLIQPHFRGDADDNERINLSDVDLLDDPSVRDYSSLMRLSEKCQEEAADRLLRIISLSKDFQDIVSKESALRNEVLEASRGLEAEVKSMINSYYCFSCSNRDFFLK